MRPAVLLALIAMGCEGKSASKTASSGSAEGRCDYTTTGTMTARGHSRGGIDAVGSDYWTPENGPGLLAIRCTGPLTLAFGAKPDLPRTALPLAPGTYEIGPFAPEIVVLAHDDTNHAFSAERGTLELTTFDEERVAGTFALDLAELSGKTTSVNIHATGSFDLPRPAR